MFLHVVHDLEIYHQEPLVKLPETSSYRNKLPSRCGDVCVEGANNDAHV